MMVAERKARKSEGANTETQDIDVISDDEEPEREPSQGNKRPRIEGTQEEVKIGEETEVEEDRSSHDNSAPDKVEIDLYEDDDEPENEDEPQTMMAEERELEGDHYDEDVQPDNNDSDEEDEELRDNNYSVK
jgi:hypothetical protein